MKKTIDLYDFQDEFRRFDRIDQFSRHGLEILFNGLEEYEADTGEDIELDVIELCCEFYEMEMSDIVKSYAHMMDDITTDDPQAVEEWLYNQTWVLGKTDSDTFIFRQF